MLNNKRSYDDGVEESTLKSPEVPHDESGALGYVLSRIRGVHSDLIAFNYRLTSVEQTVFGPTPESDDIGKSVHKEFGAIGNINSTLDDIADQLKDMSATIDKLETL